MVYLAGGGVCLTPQDCFQRSLTDLGSSKHWSPQMSSLGDGILSTDATVNPDFYSWNIVFVQYCDGGRYTSDALHPLSYNSSLLYFRGKKIVESVFLDLLKNRGMDSAKRILFTGCSAGGEGVLYLSDHVRGLVPKQIEVKALADAGWFLDTLNIHNLPSMYMKNLPPAYAMWNSSSTLYSQCTSQYGWKCLFAQYLYKYITIPLFILQSEMDVYQLAQFYELPCDGSNCNSTEITLLNEFSANFRSAILPAIDNPQTGIFLDMCPRHCQGGDNGDWFKLQIDGRSAANLFSSWYFERPGPTKAVDTCGWPCNKSCPN